MTSLAIVEHKAADYLVGEGMPQAEAVEALKNARAAATWDGARYFTPAALSAIVRAHKAATGPRSIRTGDNVTWKSYGVERAGRVVADFGNALRIERTDGPLAGRVACMLRRSVSLAS